MVSVGKREQAGGCLHRTRNIFSCCIMRFPRLEVTTSLLDAGALMALGWWELLAGSRLRWDSHLGFAFLFAVGVCFTHADAGVPLL